MKKIKLLSLLLAVLMLTGVVALFSSCAGTAGEIEPSKKTVDVDLTGYTVLYGDSQSGGNISSLVRKQFDAVVSAVKDATGLSLKSAQASRSEPEDGAKEILLGATNRKESEKALSGIKGDGFVIKVTDDKIVVVGTSNLYTMMAVDYFVKNYLTGIEKSKTVTFNETVKANKLSSVVVVDSATEDKDYSNDYTYVYKNGLGMLPDAYISKKTDPSVSTYSEFPMLAASTLVEKMIGISNLSVKHFTIGTDADTAQKEVLIGQTNREESQAALQQIDETQYIITVNGDRVVINAWSNYVLSQAMDTYYDLLKEATVKDEAGNTKVVLPRDFRLVGDATHTWFTDFPKPEGEGIALKNTMDNNDNSLQYLYTGTGVNRTSYDAYCAQLKAAGYKEYMTNETEGSVFKVFKNDIKKTVLYVALNAYAHKDDFSEFDWTVSKVIDSQVIDPYGFEPSIRIVSSTFEDAFLPDANLLKKSSYTPITQTSITTMPIYSSAVGVSFVITLEDGRLLVFDGGSINAGSREQDRLWNLLRELNEKATGAKTSTSNPIRIAAWVLSHAHIDHYHAFRSMLQTYGKTGEVKMEYMIANIPSAEAYMAGKEFSEVTTVMDPVAIKSLQASITGGFKLIKPHTGMTFHIGNVKLETMVTWEDLNPVQVPNTNDTNTVQRLTISSAESSDTTTMMWLGDANRNQSRFMCATFGTYLKSDITSVAHHGNAGCEVDLYEMIDPETIFWTHNTAAAERYLNPASKDSGWQYEVDQYFTYELASVKRIFTAGAQLFYVAGTGTAEESIVKGELPAYNGFVYLQFVDGVAQYDDVQEICFKYEKKDGKWVTTSTSMNSLAHTDISGGSAAFVKNDGYMSFVSNYMVKCNKECPTGEHTH